MYVLYNTPTFIYPIFNTYLELAVATFVGYNNNIKTP